MKVVVIGAGNVATHFARFLKAANIKVVQIWSYHYENALILAKEVNAVAIANLSEVDEEADLCLIAVKDDVIANLIPQLRKFKGIVAHTSGAVDLGVFDDQLENCGVFYPLQTFSKDKEISFSNVPICIEGSNAFTLASLKLIANKLSDKVLEVSSEKRRVLHLSAVFACNFTNHLYALAEELLTKNALDFDLLRPLISETANKIVTELPKNVQTGPSIRNDITTIGRHVAMLEDDPNLQNIYTILSDSIKKSR